MSKHTTVPWEKLEYCKIEEPDNPTRILVIKASNGDVIFSLENYPSKKDEANVDFIICACNAHDKLHAFVSNVLCLVDRGQCGWNEIDNLLDEHDIHALMEEKGWPATIKEWRKKG